MIPYKNLNSENIKKFRDELIQLDNQELINNFDEDIKEYCKKDNIYNFRFKLLKFKLIEIIREYDELIVEIDYIDEINEIKRLIYNHMLLSKSNDLYKLNQVYYNLYQDLKVNKINLVEAIENFKSIEL
jgi:hypothetical protein